MASGRRTQLGLLFLCLVACGAWRTLHDEGRGSPAKEDLRLDQYGGLTGVPCPGGKRPHFYAQKIGQRWSLCTPAGHAFWMLGVYNVGGEDTGIDYQGLNLGALLQAKYKTGPTANPALNAALADVRRMQAWGFNTIAEFSLGWTLPVGVHPQWPTADRTIPIKLPFVTFPYPALYSLSNSGRFAAGPVKDIVAGIKPNVLPGFRADSPDFWLPYQPHVGGDRLDALRVVALTLVAMGDEEWVSGFPEGFAPVRVCITTIPVEHTVRMRTSQTGWSGRAAAPARSPTVTGCGRTLG